MESQCFGDSTCCQPAAARVGADSRPVAVGHKETDGNGFSSARDCGLCLPAGALSCHQGNGVSMVFLALQSRWENNFKNRSRAGQSARSRGCTGFAFACTTAMQGHACITAQPKKKNVAGCSTIDHCIVEAMASCVTSLPLLLWVDCCTGQS